MDYTLNRLADDEILTGKLTNSSLHSTVVADTLEHHPRGVTQAFADIRRVLTVFDFERRQGSLYTTAKDYSRISSRRSWP